MSVQEVEVDVRQSVEGHRRPRTHGVQLDDFTVKGDTNPGPVDDGRTNDDLSLFTKEVIEKPPRRHDDYLDIVSAERLLLRIGEGAQFGSDPFP